MTTISKKRLNGVDTVKFIMAFAVVTIHIQPLFNVNYAESINWFIRLAVPYFFIASGFLTARGLSLLNSRDERVGYLKNRALRFGKMFLIWLLIYLPLSLASFNYSNVYVLSKNIAWYVVNVILTGETKLAWPIWYLYSSMIAYFILSVLCRYKCRRITVLLLAVLIIAGSLALPYLMLPQFVEYCVKGFFERILGGIPYILTGILLFKYSNKVSNVILALSSMALSYILFYFDVNIFPLLGGASLFLISYMIILPNNGLYNNLNAIGIWIYLTHMFNLIAIKVFLMLTDISMDKYYLLLVSLIFTFITSSAINQLSKTKGFMWLKKLI